MKKANGHNEQWKTVKLGEYALIVRGGSPRPIDSYITSDENGINWIKIGDIDVNGKYVEKTSEKIIPEGKLYSREVHKGDFILSNSMSFGRPYILKIDGCIHDGWLAIQNYEQTFDTNFLFYVLSSDLVKKQYLSMASGSTVLNLNKEKVAQIEISYPDSLPAQRRIAAILSAADKVIEQTRQLIGKYKSIKQGMMEDLLKPKEGWKKVKLGDVAQTFTGLTYSPSNINSSGTLVLRSSNIKDGRLCFEDNVFVSMDIPERAMVHEDDILICVRNGSRNLIGKCALITKDAVGMAFGAFMTVLRAITIDPGFLLFIWQSNGIQRQVANNIGATINQITNADFNRFEISVPDLPEQRRIAKILSGIDRKIEAEEKVLEKYEKIKKGLMERVLKKENSIN